MRIKKGLSTLFLSHQNADPDAVGSIFFLKNRIGGDIGLPDPPDEVAKRLVEYFSMEYTLEPDLSKYEQIIVIDTASREQLRPIEIDDVEDLIVIDHHSSNHWKHDVIFQKRTSCAEIVYDLIHPEEITEKEAVGLLAGIMTDTSHFRRADFQTFRIASEIMEKSSVKVEQVANIIEKERSYSEKICRLKGIQRSDYIEVNGYLVAYTRVKVFESSVSNLLLNAGADIGFTGSKRDGMFLISGRVDADLVDSGIDIGKIFKDIAASETEVSGGGHEGAAVLKGIGDCDKYLEKCVDHAVDHIRKKGLGRAKD